MNGPRVIVLPALARPADAPPGFPALVSYPRHASALRWPSLPLDEALASRWDVDAHVLGYAPRALGDGHWYRLSVEVLSSPEGDGYDLAVAFADLDRPGHAPWSSALDAELAVALLREVYPEAAIYGTRAGVRLVWVLAEPVPLRLARWWLRAWHAHAARQLPPELGLEWDHSAAEWSRGFRLPYVVRGGLATSPPVDLATRPLVWTPDTDPEIDLGTGAGPVTPVGDAPPVPDAPAPPGWAAWVGPSTVAGRIVPLLTSGDPWGPPLVPEGARNSTLKAAVNSVAFQVRRGASPAPTPGELWQIFAPSVAADRGGEHLADLWRFVNAAAASEAARRAPLVDTATDAPDKPPALVTSEDSTGYVFHPERGAYMGPLRGTEILLALREHHAEDVPLTRANGRATRPIAEILLAHAHVAERVELHYPGAERDAAPWSADTRTVRVRTLTPAVVEPQEDPAVAEWLDVLLSEASDLEASRALDWLATAHRLDRPTSALYLQGPPRGGKGLLAAGVAALWGCGVTSFREAVGRFNDGLLRSPVVFLDEGAPHWGEMEDVSALFRSLVAERTHRVEPKGKAILTLRGCPRVIVAANNDRAIPLGREQGAEDLAALVGRILHVPTSGDAERWLREYGGSDRLETEGWVRTLTGEVGRVPRHLAWLAATRSVQTGSSYLVEGVLGRYHVRLVTGDELYGQTLYAIAVALVPPAGAGAPGGPGVWTRPGEGLAWVNPVDLHARWRSLVVEDRHRPTLQRVADALAALSRAGSATTVTRGGRSAAYWPIPAELVLRTADDLGLADLHRLRAAFAAGTDGVATGAVVDLTRRT